MLNKFQTWFVNVDVSSGMHMKCAQNIVKYVGIVEVWCTLYWQYVKHAATTCYVRRVHLHTNHHMRTIFRGNFSKYAKQVCADDCGHVNFNTLSCSARVEPTLLSITRYSTYYAAAAVSTYIWWLKENGCKHVCIRYMSTRWVIASNPFTIEWHNKLAGGW